MSKKIPLIYWDKVIGQVEITDPSMLNVLARQELEFSLSTAVEVGQDGDPVLVELGLFAEPAEPVEPRGKISDTLVPLYEAFTHRKVQ